MQIVIRKSWFIALLALLLVTLITTLSLLVWMLRHLGAEVALRDQLAQVAVDQPLPLTVQLQDDLDIQVAGTVNTVVPVRQVVEVPLQDSLDVTVDFDGAVDLSLDVPFSTTVVVDEMMPLEAELDVKVLGVWTKLPIRGVLPIRLQVPVDTMVPVHQKLQLAFTQAARVEVNQTLKVPLDTEIQAAVPVNSTLRVPQPPLLHAQASLLEPAQTTISQLDLKLPLHQIGLSWKDQPLSLPSLFPAALAAD